MLTQSTSKIARNALVESLHELDYMLANVKRAITYEAQPLGRRNQSELYYALLTTRDSIKKKRKKIANAIKELKDFTWTGRPEDLE